MYESAYHRLETAPLYAAPWWLDSTCGPDGWEIYMFSEDDHSPIAFLPYHKTTIRGMPAIINPPMSQWLPVLKLIAGPKILLADFFTSLTAFSILDVSFRQDSSILLAGLRFPVYSKYSYLLDASQNIELIKSRYNEGLRRNLKEAVKKYTISETDDLNTFLMLCNSTYQQRKIRAPGWLQSVPHEVFKALVSHQRGRIEVAYHKNKPIAGIMTGWDKQASYYLLGGRTGDEEGASAHAVLLDHAIMKSHDAGRSFDFEGSMHPGIANFFQSFGATPVAYWQIKKYKGAGKIWAILNK